MKILIVSGIFPPDIGGPATYVPQIAEHLAGHGHQITVVTLSDELGHEDQHYSFRVVRLPRQIFKPWRWLRTALLLARLGRQFDLLFVNGLAFEATLANYFLRKPMVQKVVGDLAWERATVRGWVQDNFEEFQEKRYGHKVELLKAVRAWWTRRAHKVIVPSHYLARFVAMWGVDTRNIVVIYNGVETTNGVVPAKVPLEPRFRIVTVGRLVPWKRVDKVIETIARMEGVGFTVIGDGPERGRVEKLAQALGVTDRVYFAGYRNRAETLALLAACHVLVLNSSYEGLPHVVLEAMSLGLPVVATAVGGTPEVLSDKVNGRLITSPRSNALYEALSQLVRFPEERQRLAKGAKQTSQRFTMHKMVEETLRVLEAMSLGLPVVATAGRGNTRSRAEP